MTLGDTRSLLDVRLFDLKSLGVDPAHIAASVDSIRVWPAPKLSEIDAAAAELKRL